MALPQPKIDALEARIAGLALPEGGWSEAARKDALSRLTAMGLPHARDEYWKFTRPAKLVETEVTPATVLAEDEMPIFDAFDRLKIVFVDGVFDAERMASWHSFWFSAPHRGAALSCPRSNC